MTRRRHQTQIQHQIQEYGVDGSVGVSLLKMRPTGFEKFAPRGWRWWYDGLVSQAR